MRQRKYTEERPLKWDGIDFEICGMFTVNDKLFGRIENRVERLEITDFTLHKNRIYMEFGIYIECGDDRWLIMIEDTVLHKKDGIITVRKDPDRKARFVFVRDYSRVSWSEVRDLFLMEEQFLSKSTRKKFLKVNNIDDRFEELNEITNGGEVTFNFNA
jgi:hypothetical protein